NRLYPENQEKTAYVEYASIYNPPDELQIPENMNKNIHMNETNQSMSESTISSNSNSTFHSPTEENRNMYIGNLSETIREIDSVSSSTTITPVTKNFPKPLFERRTSQTETKSAQSSPIGHRRKVLSNILLQKSFDLENNLLMEQINNENNSSMTDKSLCTISKITTNRTSELLPSSNRPTPPFPFPKQNRKTEKSTLMKHGIQNFNTIMANRQRDFLRQQSVETKANTHSDNQQFLK
ncbi:unnamed protein product, partial [Adineta steineri]